MFNSFLMQSRANGGCSLICFRQHHISRTRIFKVVIFRTSGTWGRNLSYSLRRRVQFLFLGIENHRPSCNVKAFSSQTLPCLKTACSAGSKLVLLEICLGSPRFYSVTVPLLPFPPSKEVAKFPLQALTIPYQYRKVAAQYHKYNCRMPPQMQLPL